jgi:cell division septation protein DedD
MPDQEVHEIQLNGKQLVFMFMAATVVSVVIFLCGVMVGRGVRQPQADAIAANTDTSIDSTSPFDALSAKPAVISEPAPAPENENLTYSERLEAPKPLHEPLKFTESTPAVSPPAPVEKPAPAKAEKVEKPASAKVEKPAPAKTVTAPEPKQPPAKTEPQRAAPKTAIAQSSPVPRTDAVPASSSFAEPPGKGFVLQVQAFPTRTAADALASRLKGKGYAAFVAVNPDNVPLKFRVRVGKYGSKREADLVADRLKREEHFKPWLTH